MPDAATTSTEAVLSLSLARRGVAPQPAAAAQDAGGSSRPGLGRAGALRPCRPVPAVRHAVAAAVAAGARSVTGSDPWASPAWLCSRPPPPTSPAAATNLKLLYATAQLLMGNRG